MQTTTEKDVCPVIVAIIAEIVGAVQGEERTSIGQMLRFNIYIDKLFEFFIYGWAHYDNDYDLIKSE